MSAEKSNIHVLEDAKKEGEEQTATEASIDATTLDEAIKSRLSTQKDMSKVAVIVSLLSVVLLVIFFFGLNRNIAGLNAEVKSLGELRGQVQSLDERLISLEDVSGQMKRTAIYNLTNEMTMESAYLEGQIEDEAQKEKLREIQKLLGEFRQGLLNK
ncbi:hypothetical protein [Salidesulfovibrio brasiliensis]|uniref:hypothetical protein n=1 Tax=Salidesulfovibrio brasiliensis TaxID=221711 RepID=UPI0006D2C7B2|nr:hypothetical protein [Salidesulfovibrio brasiliensis]